MKALARGLTTAVLLSACMVMSASAEARTLRIERELILIGFTDEGNIWQDWPGYGRTVFTDPNIVGTSELCWGNTDSFTEFRGKLLDYRKIFQSSNDGATPLPEWILSGFPFKEVDGEVVWGYMVAYARFVDCGVKLGGVWHGTLCVDTFPFDESDDPGYDLCGYMTELREFRSEDINLGDLAAQQKSVPRSARKKTPWWFFRH